VPHGPAGRAVDAPEGRLLSRRPLRHAEGRSPALRPQLQTRAHRPGKSRPHRVSEVAIEHQGRALPPLCHREPLGEQGVLSAGPAIYYGGHAPHHSHDRPRRLPSAPRRRGRDAPLRQSRHHRARDHGSGAGIPASRFRPGLAGIRRHGDGGRLLPRLGNAMGALYNAKFSGSPVILKAGQQAQGHGLLEPMLYEPLVQVAQPLVKWAFEVTRAADLPRIIHRAAKIALTPPTGPVFLSLPGDLLDESIEMDLGRPVRVSASSRPSDDVLKNILELLLRAKHPAILAGQELATRDAFAEAAELAELVGAAVFQSSIPYSAQFPTEHPAFMGALTRAQKQVRATLEPYDLLLCLGADLLRMSVYSPVEPLPEHLPVIHVSERAHELGKNYRTDLAVNANVKQTLRALLPLLRSKN